jgi:hypothetical protein
MNGNKHMKTITNITYPAFALFALASFALAPQARAVCQDACLTNQNTVQGDDALFSLTTGFGDTAIGFQALYSNTIGHGNNAIGVQALYSNIDGIDNTAIGYFTLLSNLSGTGNTAIGDYALYSNINGGANTATGDSALASNTTGNNNTANGVEALFSNTTGSANTAGGVQALWSNTTGSGNTATGTLALFSNTTGEGNTATGQRALNANTKGFDNTATGLNALRSNTTGESNTATGRVALLSNTTGGSNTATGRGALRGNTIGDSNTATGRGALNMNTTGSSNVATGYQALFNNTIGSGNIALGDSAGINLTTGNNNIDIGNFGVAGEANTIRIGAQGTQTSTFVAGISGVAVMGPAVHVSSSGQLGAQASSRRFKDDIKPMDKASEAILALEPVSFRYKREIDPDRTPQFGLVAEQVEKVDPALVARDADGKPYTVRYESVNAMLLNEFLKEHRQVHEQGATIAELKSIAAKQEMINAQHQREIKALAATLREQASQIQKVSAQLELEKASAQTVVNNQ